LEDGSDLAAELWDHASSLASSVLCYPEGRAALAAAQRSGRLSRRQHRRAVGEFDAVHEELTLIGADAGLAARAGALAEESALRGYDAMHLATALALGDNALFVTWDVDLGRAAHDAGCPVSPPVSA